MLILPATLAFLAAKGGSDDSVRNFALALKAFGAGGWIVSFIGAAAIFAIIAFFVTYAWKLSALNKAIIQGLTGALAPELVEWITHTVREKLGLLKGEHLAARKKRRKRSSGRKRSKPKAKKPASRKTGDSRRS